MILFYKSGTRKKVMVGDMVPLSNDPIVKVDWDTGDVMHKTVKEFNTYMQTVVFPRFGSVASFKFSAEPKAMGSTVQGLVQAAAERGFEGS
jgi:hypothetical protein